MKNNLFNDYRDLLDQQQEEINNLPKFFALSDEQFEKGLKKYQEQYPETIGQEIYSFGYGMFATKKHLDLLLETFKKHDSERKEYLANDEVLENAFYVEFWNREYGFDEYDDNVTGAVLNKDYSELTERELEIYNKARKRYLDKFFELGF